MNMCLVNELYVLLITSTNKYLNYLNIFFFNWNAKMRNSKDTNHVQQFFTY